MSQVMVFGTKSATEEEVERALIKEEVDELISRLSTDERRDLLESLRKRWNDERKELKSIYGVSHEQVQARTTAAPNQTLRLGLQQGQRVSYDRQGVDGVCEG